MMYEERSVFGTLAVLMQCPPIRTTVLVLSLPIGAHRTPWKDMPLLLVDYRI